jgi:hypothetical protein
MKEMIADVHNLKRKGSPVETEKFERILRQRPNIMLLVLEILRHTDKSVRNVVQSKPPTIKFLAETLAFGDSNPLTEWNIAEMVLNEDKEGLVDLWDKKIKEDD